MDRIEIACRYLLYRRVKPPGAAANRVYSIDEMLDYIRARVSGIARDGGKIGCLLSGGMDSAVIAGFLPSGSIAYTFDYPEVSRCSEWLEARDFIKPGVMHKKVTISKADFFNAASELTQLLKEPVVPHAPAIFLAAVQASQDGCTHLLNGVGADGRFGGFPELYKASRKNEFLVALKKKFVDPETVMRDPVDVTTLVEDYVTADIVDVQRYLVEVGTEGTAVADTIRCANITPGNLFGEIQYGGSFIEEGLLGKKFIKRAFSIVWPSMAPRKKKALAVPYSKWLKSWQPTHPSIRSDSLSSEGLRSKNRMQIFAVDLYLRKFE